VRRNRTSRCIWFLWILTNLRTKAEHFSIPNEPTAIRKWLAHAKLPRKLITGSEATGSYHIALARGCTEHGLTFKVINPILTKQFTRATVRKQKTDRSDCLVIAKLLAQGEGNIFAWDARIEAAKRANRLQVLIGRYEIGLRLHAQTGAADPYLEDIGAFLRERKKMREKELRTEHRDNADLALLMSIPGIGWKSAFAVWSEIGSIEKFSCAKQLVAFAGLDPKIRQSGHTLNNQGKLTKRGSPYLRRALFLAANCARQRDSELKDYYWKKRGEGKKHTVATCATARKLIARIHAVWSRRTPYLPTPIAV
jgi:transposase